jgi:sugar phosphate isomerase/epimerase
MSKFILSAFADEISPNLKEQIDVLREHQIGYVEFRGLEGKVIIDYSPDEIREVAHQLADNGIKVSALGSPIGKIMIDDPFEEHLERFKKAMETAHLLGTSNIRMFSFFLPFGENPSQYRDEVLRRWTAFIQASEGSGLTLLHENEKMIYGDNAERCLDLLQSLNHSRVQATFDPANFVQCQVESYPHAFQMLEKHIAYMHIKDAMLENGEVVPAGQGDGKLPEILKTLWQKDFEGFLSIEPHLNNSDPGGGPKMFGVAVSALRDVLAKIGAAA